jgi:hypothetical protein
MNARIVIDEHGWNIQIGREGNHCEDCVMEFESSMSEECFRQKLSEFVKQLQAILRNVTPKREKR